MPSAANLKQKQLYNDKLCKLLDDHDRAFLVHADNVGSKQFMNIRAVRRCSPGRFRDCRKLGLAEKSKQSERGRAGRGRGLWTGEAGTRTGGGLKRTPGGGASPRAGGVAGLACDLGVLC